MNYSIILKQKEKIISTFLIDPIIFSEFSSKFKQEFQRNPQELIILKPYNPLIFESFVNACQKKQFSTSENEAYELLKLSQEWQVLALEEFCRNYIKKSCLILPYYIIHKNPKYKEFKYPINPILFSKMSTKFLMESKNKPDELIIEDNHTPWIFLTFIAACQQRTVTTSYDEIDELNEIATEWGAPSLQNFCQKYKEKNLLINEPEINYLNLLISKLEKKEDSTEEIINLSKFLKFYLNKEEFLRIPTLVFYKILNLSEKRGLDQNLLINCILKKLETYTSSAVPLVLRINFDYLNSNDYSIIFGYNKIHEQNINFFVAMSLSSINENTLRNVESLKTRFKRDVEEITKNIEIENNNIFEKAKKARLKDFNKIKIALAQQQSTMDDLFEVLETQKIALNDSIERSKKIPSNDQLQQRAKFEITKTIAKVGKIINDNINEADIKAQEKLKLILNENQQLLDNALNGLGDIDIKSRERMLKSQESLNKTNNKLNIMKKQLNTIQSVMATKVVQDKFKLDKFIRNTENKSLIFNQEPGIWNVTFEEFEISNNEILKEIEKRIEKLCPISENKNSI